MEEKSSLSDLTECRGINEAMRDGSKLTIKLGDRLHRVVELSKEDCVTGYASEPDMETALAIAGRDYLAGHPGNHVNTHPGIPEHRDNVDRWVLAARKVKTNYIEGGIYR